MFEHMASSASNESLISLLKIDDKGWNIQLLANNDDAYQCKACHNICCNAVELGCDHDDDDEIDLYCHVCLNEIIKSNNNICPINKTHRNPPIQSVRATRKQIMKLKVYCPNSVEYENKKQKNDENMGVYDTMDEKEGDLHKSGKNNCHWNGSLAQLINDHITKCKAATNDLNKKMIQLMNERINKMQKETTKLTFIVQKQQEKTKQIQNEIIQIKSENEQINQIQQQQIKEMQKNLQLKDDAINGIQKQMKLMSQQLRIYEEKKEDEENTKEIKYTGIFLQKNVGTYLDVISQHQVRRKTSGGSAKCDKSLPVITNNTKAKNIWFWKVQFTNPSKSGYIGNLNIFAGVVPTDTKNVSETASGGLIGAYGLSGYVHYVFRGKGTFENLKPSFPIELCWNDIICLEYNMSNSSLTMKINNKITGTLQLPRNTEWVPTVSLRYDGTVCALH